MIELKERQLSLATASALTTVVIKAPGSILPRLPSPPLAATVLIRLSPVPGLLDITLLTGPDPVRIALPALLRHRLDPELGKRTLPVARSADTIMSLLPRRLHSLGATRLCHQICYATLTPRPVPLPPVLRKQVDGQGFLAAATRVMISLGHMIIILL
jgi:hypothetical protein